MLTADETALAIAATSITAWWAGAPWWVHITAAVAYAAWGIRGGRL